MTARDDLDLLFDLGIALPGPIQVETRPGHIESFASRAAARKAMMGPTVTIPATSRYAGVKRVPQPPYRCLCGVKFDSAEEFLDHCAGVRNTPKDIFEHCRKSR